MTRSAKIAAIEQHAEDLTDLAKNYAKLATITHKLSDELIDVLYRFSVANNESHQSFAEEVQTHLR